MDSSNRCLRKTSIFINHSNSSQNPYTNSMSTQEVGVWLQTNFERMVLKVDDAMPT